MAHRVRGTLLISDRCRAEGFKPVVVSIAIPTPSGREDLSVTYERLDYELRFWNVEGEATYAVVGGRTA